MKIRERESRSDILNLVDAMLRENWPKKLKEKGTFPILCFVMTLDDETKIDGVDIWGHPQINDPQNRSVVAIILRELAGKLEKTGELPLFR